MAKLVSTLFVFFLFNSLNGIAQDTIVKMNNDTMIVQIDNIYPYWIRYKDYYFLDGPFRSIEKEKVSHIIYSDNKIVLISRKMIMQADTIIKKTKNPLIRNGIYIDVMPGYTHLIKRGTSSKSDYVGIGIRFGNKWYFGDTLKSRHGLSMNWLKLGIYANNHETNLMASILNPGYTGIFRFKNNQALETTLNLGLAAANNIEMLLGYNVDAGVFYRKSRLSVGFLYSFLYGNRFSIISWGGNNDGYSSGIIHTYSFSIGVKF